MNRRKFIGVLGIGTASAPLAAKAALEQETMKFVNSGTTIASTVAGIVGSAPIGSSDEATTRIRMADYLKVFGKLPDHVMEQLRQDAKWVQSLDFDIANKRSWSLAAKVHEQRQRNLQNRLAQIEHNGAVSRAKQLFAKTFGFEFLTW